MELNRAAAASAIIMAPCESAAINGRLVRIRAERAAASDFRIASRKCRIGDADTLTAVILIHNGSAKAMRIAVGKGAIVNRQSYI